MAGGDFGRSSGALGRGENTTNLEEGQGVLDEDGEGRDGAGDRYVVGAAVGRVAAPILGAAFEHVQVVDAQLNADAAEELAAFLIRFEEGHREGGKSDTQGNARQSSTAADVDDSRARGRVHDASVAEGAAEGDCFEEVAAVYFAGVAKGGEVEAGARLDEGGAVALERSQLVGGDVETERPQALGEADGRPPRVFSSWRRLAGQAGTAMSSSQLRGKYFILSSLKVDLTVTWRAFAACSASSSVACRAPMAKVL